ncbi:MAG: HD domain-containing protein [Clostridiales bacterium]|nr:HD domain-containing protein [Clostridiales bacterium]
MEQAIIERAKNYIRMLFRDHADGHDVEHTMRVYRSALNIAGHYPDCDTALVSLAALLHDVDDTKLFRTKDNANAREFLRAQNVEEKRIDSICAVINAVSFSKNKGTAPETIEGKIVQDADRLDAMGAIGIARTFAYGGKTGRSLDSSIEHFHDKLLKLKDMMNTPEAREMAEERHAFLEQFLEEYKNEANGV